MDFVTLRINLSRTHTHTHISNLKQSKSTQTQEMSTHRTTLAVSTHSGCKLSQESTITQSELSVANRVISRRWQASIKPFFLYASPTGEMIPLTTLYWPYAQKKTCV